MISKTGDGNYRSSLELRDSDDKVLLKLPDVPEDKDRDIIVKQLNLNMSRILKMVTDKSNYKIKPSSGKYILNLECLLWQSPGSNLTIKLMRLLQLTGS